jgi:hypothetical protein
MEAIFARAGYYATAEKYPTPSGAGMLLSRALAMAAVEVIEGQARELTRKRRRPGSSARESKTSHGEAVERVAEGLIRGDWPHDPAGWEVRRRPR